MDDHASSPSADDGGFVVAGSQGRQHIASIELFAIANTINEPSNCRSPIIVNFNLQVIPIVPPKFRVRKSASLAIKPSSFDLGNLTAFAALTAAFSPA